MKPDYILVFLMNRQSINVTAVWNTFKAYSCAHIVAHVQGKNSIKCEYYYTVQYWNLIPFKQLVQKQGRRFGTETAINISIIKDAQDKSILLVLLNN